MLSAALACAIAAILTLTRGYGQIGSVALSMVLAFGLVALVLGLIVSLKTPGGVEKYYAEKREELAKLQEEYAEIRAKARSERAAAWQREQEEAQIRAAEESSRQQPQYEADSQAERTPVVDATVGTAGDAMDRVACPKCGCSQVTVQKKGFGGGCACCGALLFGPLGLLCGLRGANQVIITCLKCGYQWRRG
jgi:tellurium resistance protein TerD